jgi:hypothetical protein
MSSFSNSYGSTRRSSASLVLQILFDEFRRVHAHGGQMAEHAVRGEPFSAIFPVMQGIYRESALIVENAVLVAATTG